MTTAGVGAGIALAIIGVFLALGGGLALSACSSATASPSPGSGPGAPATPAADCGGFVVLAVVGGILLVIGVIVAIVAGRNYTYVAPRGNPAIPPPIFAPVPNRPTAAPGLPAVRCIYCGTMAEGGATHCPSCGAPL